MNKPSNWQDVLFAAQTADLKTDWQYDILDMMPPYWQGYFTSFNEELNGILASDSQEYRDALVSRMRGCWE